MVEHFSNYVGVTDVIRPCPGGPICRGTVIDSTPRKLEEAVCALFKRIKCPGNMPPKRVTSSECEPSKTLWIDVQGWGDHRSVG